MMQIVEAGEKQAGHPLWNLAFRAGFLAAGLLAVAAMGRWMWWLESPTAWGAPLTPAWWHAHEMLFGFALPVVAGFLLTAVATWTGIQGTRGIRLQVLFGLWLLARSVLWLTPDLLWLAWAAEMAFILLLCWELVTRLLVKKQWRNFWFPPVLLTLAILDTVSFLFVSEPLLTTRLFYAMLWLITTLVVIVGGRVIPLFTANRLKITIGAHPQWFEYLSISSILLMALLFAIFPVPAALPGFTALCLLIAAIHGYRMIRWHGWQTLGIPLLWSMHLSYLCIPLTLIAIALAGSDPIALKNALHLLAIGGVGGMILTMMSRVSLGHTGRSLDALPAGMAWAFGALMVAAGVRAFAPSLDPTLTQMAWRISGVLWLLVFGGFLWRYWPILSRPRVDGKPG